MTNAVKVEDIGIICNDLSLASTISMNVDFKHYSPLYINKKHFKHFDETDYLVALVHISDGTSLPELAEYEAEGITCINIPVNGELSKSDFEKIYYFIHSLKVTN